MGWREKDLAETILFMTRQHREDAGRRAARLRKSKGWSQEDLAHHADVSVKTISRFEAGRHEGRRNTVKQIAAALEVTQAELLGEPPAPLGLGAREDQVDKGFVEFRGHVTEILERLDAQAEEVSQLRETVRVLIAVLQPDEGGDDLAPGHGDAPAPPEGEDRRRGDRRHSG
jgi:transcriptional regulator with XRE-family HTH domain